MLPTFKTFFNHEPRNYTVCINNYGYRVCSPGFSPGYVTPEYYVIHYVYDGKCIFETKSASYTVNPGQMFIMTPGNVYTHTSDSVNPCTYRWVDITGKNFDKFLTAIPFSLDNPILTDDENQSIGKLLKEMTDKGKMSGKEINGYSWFLADALCKREMAENNVWDKYIEPAIEYIISNSERKTTVSEVADYLKIDRSYLSRVFNECMGIPIKKYIYNYHMDIAKSFLAHSDMPIRDVALAVGYSDPLDFTKAFHRTYGISPTKWREENKQ